MDYLHFQDGNDEDEDGTESVSSEDSLERRNELEARLYSIIHHNDLSQPLPSDLSERFAVDYSENGEVIVSVNEDLDKTEKDIVFNKINLIKSCSQTIDIDSDDEEEEEGKVTEGEKLNRLGEYKENTENVSNSSKEYSNINCDKNKEYGNIICDKNKLRYTNALQVCGINNSLKSKTTNSNVLHGYENRIESRCMLRCSDWKANADMEYISFKSNFKYVSETKSSEISCDTSINKMTTDALEREMSTETPNTEMRIETCNMEMITETPERKMITETPEKDIMARQTQCQDDNLKVLDDDDEIRSLEKCLRKRLKIYYRLVNDPLVSTTKRDSSFMRAQRVKERLTNMEESKMRKCNRTTDTGDDNKPPNLTVKSNGGNNACDSNDEDDRIIRRIEKRLRKESRRLVKIESREKRDSAYRRMQKLLKALTSLKESKMKNCNSTTAASDVNELPNLTVKSNGGNSVCNSNDKEVICMNMSSAGLSNECIVLDSDIEVVELESDVSGTKQNVQKLGVHNILDSDVNDSGDDLICNFVNTFNKPCVESDLINLVSSGDEQSELNNENNKVHFKHKKLPFLDTPKKWTKKMIKFYCKSSKEKRSFDCLKLIKDMRKTSSWCDWVINKDDLIGLKKHQPRCRRCREIGHVERKCKTPISPIVCYMCGEPNHIAGRCPQAICLFCGRKMQFYTEKCVDCILRLSSGENCKICNGEHWMELCPNLWRCYHLTTKEGPIVIPNEQKVNPRRYCWVCAGKGHFAHECNNPYYGSKEVQTTCFVTNYNIVNTQEVREIVLSVNAQAKLNSNYGAKFLQNLSDKTKVQIDYVTGDGCLPVIKVHGNVKVWKIVRHELLKFVGESFMYQFMTANEENTCDMPVTNNKGENIVHKNIEQKNAMQKNIVQKNIGQKNVVQKNIGQKNVAQRNIEQEKVQRNIVKKNIDQKKVRQTNIVQNNIQQKNIEQENVQKNIYQNNIDQKNIEQKNIVQNNIDQKNIEQKTTEQKNIVHNNIDQVNIEQKNAEQKNIVQYNIDQKNIEQKNTEQKNIGQKNIDQKNVHNNVNTNTLYSDILRIMTFKRKTETNLKTKKPKRNLKTKNTKNKSKNKKQKNSREQISDFVRLY